MTSKFHQLSIICTSLLLLTLLGCQAPDHMTKQESVHHMGHTVMPFDLSQTMHYFQMTESGGVLSVRVKDMATMEQVEMIRQHLHKEAGAFQRGDYSDPSSLHGTEMPGLNELQAGVENINIHYSMLPDGASITFETSDLHLLTAIHRWFGAQLSEHGSDAKAE